MSHLYSINTHIFLVHVSPSCLIFLSKHFKSSYYAMLEHLSVRVLFISKELYDEDKAYLLKLGSLESLVLYGSVHNSTIKFQLVLILLKGQLHVLTLFAVKSPNVKCICEELWPESPPRPSIQNDFVDWGYIPDYGTGGCPLPSVRMILVSKNQWKRP